MENASSHSPFAGFRLYAGPNLKRSSGPKRHLLNSLRRVWPQRGGGIVLIYHRIRATQVDPWSKCVHPTHFESQILHLKRHYQVVPLTELLGRLANGSATSDTVALTFDDGYADFLTAAYPILRLHQVPATLFAVAQLVEHGGAYWDDILADLLLRYDDLPARLDARDVGLAECLSTRTPEDRKTAFSILYRHLRSLEANSRERGIRHLIAWSGRSGYEVSEPHRSLHADELFDLTRDGLISVGSHTQTHPALSELPFRFQLEELATSRQSLTRIVGHEVVHVAYPYGNYNAETFCAAAAAGYEAGFTTSRRPVRNLTERYRLPRCWVNSWDTTDFDTYLRQIT